MLYKIGTMRELPTLPCAVPEPAYTNLVMSLVVLDAEYGESRNYMEEGGYCLIVEAIDDFPMLKATIDYETHPCEWATRQGDYVTALFLLNDDYSIMVFAPITATPQAILNDLEEQSK